MEKLELFEQLDKVDSARVNGDELDLTLEETIEAIKATIGQIEVDIDKFNAKGNKQAGKRVRRFTKSLETLGRQFRKLSV